MFKSSLLKHSKWTFKTSAYTSQKLTRESGYTHPRLTEALKAPEKKQSSKEAFRYANISRPTYPVRPTNVTRCMIHQDFLEIKPIKDQMFGCLELDWLSSSYPVNSQLFGSFCLICILWTD